jgi:hypothetical protein
MAALWNYLFFQLRAIFKKPLACFCHPALAESVV